MLGVVEEGPDAAEVFFNQWVREVKAEVPKERLLVFEVKEGWKPLCEFLGLPQPGEIIQTLQYMRHKLTRYTLLQMCHFLT